jgi:hypothetical protein
MAHRGGVVSRAGAATATQWAILTVSALIAAGRQERYARELEGAA